jgi:hypothetical protein
MLCDQEKAGFESEAQVFVEAGSQTPDPLGLLQELKGTHFPFVIGSSADFARARRRELRVARLAITQRRKARRHARYGHAIRRLAAEAARYQ